MKIVFVKPVSRFAIEVGFEDGAHGIVDLADIAGRKVFSQWMNEGIFESVKITSSGALEWPGDAGTLLKKRSFGMMKPESQKSHSISAWLHHDS